MYSNSVEDCAIRNVTRLHAQSGKVFEDKFISLICDFLDGYKFSNRGERYVVHVRNCRDTVEDTHFGTDVMTYIVSQRGKTCRTRWDITEKPLDAKSFTRPLEIKPVVLRGAHGEPIGSVHFGLRYANGHGADRQFHEDVVVVSVCAEQGLDMVHNRDDLMTVARALHRAWMRIMVTCLPYGVVGQLTPVQSLA